MPFRLFDNLADSPTLPLTSKIVIETEEQLARTVAELRRTALKKKVLQYFSEFPMEMTDLIISRHASKFKSDMEHTGRLNFRGVLTTQLSPLQETGMNNAEGEEDMDDGRDDGGSGDTSAEHVGKDNP